jgi:uncharacterized membrane protein YhiD involved in acid resistance
MQDFLLQFWNHLISYFTQLRDLIHPLSLVIDLIVCTLLALGVASFYVRYGNAVSNRARFAANFVPLALTTMSIMVIVKPSVALSLGLVGALSIVRFRAAIKDPEELTYLFLTIAIGLATGADQPIIAIIVVVFILLFLYLSKKIANDGAFKKEDRFYVNVTTDLSDVLPINKALERHFNAVELKRLDTLPNKGLDLSFICKMASIEDIQAAKEAITALSERTELSIIDQPDLII